MRYPFIKLPVKVEATLLLIREELKSRSFFNRLDKVGLQADNAQCHLYSLIAYNLGIDISRDEDFDKFTNILETASSEVDHEMQNDELMTIVIKVYVTLVTNDNLKSVD